MDARKDLESGDVEWLDIGPPERPDSTRPGGRIGRQWYLLAVAVVAVAVLVIVLPHGAKHPTAAASHPPTTTAPAPTPRASFTTHPPPPITVRTVGHRILDVPPDWELFGRGTDGIVRIQLARGRITQTTVPPLDSGGGISFVVGRDRAIIRPWDNVPGFGVQDGQPSRSLPASLGTEGPVLPGPDPDHVWVTSGDGKQVNLVGLNGRPTGTSLPTPDGTGSVNPDGAGYVMFYGTGGAYDVRPDGISRITTGELLAAGPTQWLTRECDAAYRCSAAVIDRATGARRTLLHAPATGSGVSGAISPDGSYAAVFAVDGSGQPSLGLLNLTTGRTVALDIPFDPQYSFSSGVCAWSPDSRYLFAAGAEGRLKVFDRHTMRLTDLGVSFPVNQVAFRSATG